MDDNDLEDDLDPDLAPFRAEAPAAAPIPPPKAPPLPPLPLEPEPLTPSLSPPQASGGSPPFQSVTLLLVREVDWRPDLPRFFEAWMTRFENKPWTFPTLALDRHQGDVQAAVCHCLARQRRVMAPFDFRVAEDLVRRGAPAHCMPVGRTLLLVFALPVWRRHKSGGTAPALPGVCAVPPGTWVCESELAEHEVVGPPSCMGTPIASWALEQWEALPMACRFASPTPPLVLYHGTEAKFLASIGHRGLLPGPQSMHAMLGPGVYLARWDKAVDFARHDVDNRPRGTAGVVVRALLFWGPRARVRMLTAEDVCGCGCGRAYVDHEGMHTRRIGVSAVGVPDNAGSATRRAEWCVKAVSQLGLQAAYYQ